jgi:hypothetical protein
VNFNDLNHDMKSEHTRHSVWERFSWWARHTLKRLELPAGDGNEIYMRWPGERVPTMPASGPQWPMRQDDWVLAA